MDYNYHTHTHLCRHATGSMEEYVKRAIEGGIKYMGFSDHIPHKRTDGEESWFRIPTERASEYFSEIARLREKYGDRIDIKAGFEMEYFPKQFVAMFENAKKLGAEYIILGEHYVEEEYPGILHASDETEKTEDLKEYVACVVDAIKTGVFTYIAHPDVLNFTGDVGLYREEMRKICIASREHNIPLEINFLGIRGRRKYPTLAFWEIAGEERSPVTFGLDAHDAENAYDGESLKVAKEMVKKYSLNYIGKPELINIQEITL